MGYIRDTLWDRLGIDFAPTDTSGIEGILFANFLSLYIYLYFIQTFRKIYPIYPRTI